MSYPKPAKFPISLLSKNTSTCSVRFNDNDLTSSLHYLPIIRDDSALIYDFYIKQFMINEFRRGKTVVLRGMLKKGKRAELQIGSTKAKLNGKAITLKTAPVIVNERLYLPAELLQLVNGVPIRWEPSKKTLWVETRYLRRDLETEDTKIKKLSSSSKTATSAPATNTKTASQKAILPKN